MIALAFKIYPADAIFHCVVPALSLGARASVDFITNLRVRKVFWLRIATPLQNDQFSITGFKKLCITYLLSSCSHRHPFRCRGCGPFVLGILQLSGYQTRLAGTAPSSETRIQKEEKPVRSRGRQRYTGDRVIGVAARAPRARSKPRAGLDLFHDGRDNAPTAHGRESHVVAKPEHRFHCVVVSTDPASTIFFVGEPERWYQRPRTINKNTITFRKSPSDSSCQDPGKKRVGFSISEWRRS